ncbi:MAG: AAA family ATPase, partial [Phycisphaerae bacterium]|nr:AAA family ATPase [Phycisphaerae bacterium]
RRLHGLAEQQQKLEARLASAEREEREATTALAEADRAVEARRRTIADLESQVSALVEEAESLSGDQRALAGRLSEEEQQGARLDSRRATLDEMIESRVGLGEAVKAVLDRAASARSDESQTETLYAKVLAPLAELIRVEAEDAPAVEAALGSALQAVVVSSVTALLASEQLGSLTGRVTFLALDAASTGRRAGSDEAGTESAARAIPAPLVADLIHADERIMPVVRRLLGRTYLVRDLDAAVMLASGPASGMEARFVTRDGVVLESDGRVTAGPMRGVEQGEGLLQRRSEMAILESKLDELDVVLARDRAELAAIDARAADLNRETASLRVTLAAEHRQLVADESRRQRHQSDLDRFRRERPAICEDLTQTTERAEAIRGEHRAIEERAGSLRRLLDEQASLAQQIEQEIESSQHAADTASERLTAARVEAGQVAEKLASARRELRRLELARDDAAQQRLRLSQSVEHREAAIAEHDRVIAECASEIAEAERQSSDWATRLGTLTDEVRAASASALSLAERVNGARQQASIIDRDWNSLEITKRELEVRRETLEQRTQEDLSLDLPWEYPEYRRMMSEGDVRRVDVEKVQPEIDELKDAIRKLGNVNLDAIEEEQSLEGRNEELIRQVADIDRAVTQLKELIERLSAVSLERFKQSFETIREYFSGQNGMFRRLFGGGKAELRLMPLPETGQVDWLESGIEVMAKPPGKEPRSISQLSGGEKTMTAVALLMSIFQSKPSPFCVLDEVDAALDDANVERFAGILRQFLDRCHFIVITHNKKTMQAADQMYGVTMQERGVSRRVQVRFEHIGEGGKIEIDAREGERTPEPVGGVAAIDAVKKSTLTRERLASMRRGKKAVELRPATEEAAQVEL